MVMNKTERDILKLLRDDARLSAKELAAMTGASEKDAAAAVKRLEQSGVIVKYNVVVNEEKLEDDHVEALIEVKVTPQHARGFDEIAEEIYAFDEVKSVYLMSGAYDLAVLVAGRSLKQVALFVSEKLSVMDKVLSTATHFILKKYKVDGVALGGSKSKRMAVNP